MKSEIVPKLDTIVDQQKQALEVVLRGRNLLVDSLLSLQTIDQRIIDFLVQNNNDCGLFEPDVFTVILQNLSSTIEPNLTSNKLITILYEPSALEDMLPMFGDEITTLIILDSINPSTIELQASHAYIPVDLHSISDRLGDSMYNKIINQNFMHIFSLSVDAGSGKNYTVIIDCKHPQIIEINQYLTHELWHVLTNMWTDATEQVLQVDHSVSYDLDTNLSKSDQMSQSIAYKIDQYLYHELFAFLGGNKLVDTFSFAEVYLGLYEQAMYPEGILVQPIFQRILYDAQDIDTLKKVLLKKISTYENKPKLQHEKLWLQSVYKHILFWDIVLKMPEYLHGLNLTTRDIALLYAFDTEGAWIQSDSPNPFDHLGPKLSELFEEILKFKSAK